MLRELNVECLAVREICSIVHDVTGAEPDTTAVLTLDGAVEIVSSRFWTASARPSKKRKGPSLDAVHQDDLHGGPAMHRDHGAS